MTELEALRAFVEVFTSSAFFMVATALVAIGVVGVLVIDAAAAPHDTEALGERGAPFGNLGPGAKRRQE